MPNYNAIVAEFQAELDSVIAQRDQLERQIVSISKAMEAIKVLAEESNEPIEPPPPLMMDSEAGFTDRVRAILRANPAKALSAIIIRDAFLKDAPKDDPKILLIHTHNTLKRLHRQQEVEEVATPEGRAYRWTAFRRGSLAERMRTMKSIEELGPNNTPEMKDKWAAATGAKKNKAFYGEK
jgi:hypothetical protein